MARVQQSDCDVSADSPDSEGLVCVNQVELLEAFDDVIRARFGVFISAAVLKPAKRRRTR
jgi:hypothetical protein